LGRQVREEGVRVRVREEEVVVVTKMKQHTRAMQGIMERGDTPAEHIQRAKRASKKRITIILRGMRVKGMRVHNKNRTTSKEATARARVCIHHTTVRHMKIVKRQEGQMGDIVRTIQEETMVGKDNNNIRKIRKEQE